MPLLKKALVAAVAAAVTTSSAFACTSVMVGKGISESGSVMISRNEDFSSNDWAKHMVVYPARTYKEGATITLSTGLEVPAPAKSLRYTAIVDWDRSTYHTPNDGKVFEERGVNELNVAMSTTNSAEVNDKAKKADQLVDNGIIEQNMLGLVLAQATSAKNGVEILGRYIEQYGSGEGNGVQFADKDGIWYMETGAGHHWIAVRVPEDKYMVVANGLRIHGIDLDSKDVMHSKGLFDMVKKNGLLENPNRKDFNFAKAFGVTGDVYNVDREWRAHSMLSPSMKLKPRQDQYPMFFSPDEKVGVDEIAAVLRSDYKGTEMEAEGKRPIAVDRNSEAHIIELYDNMPEELSAVIWQTPSNVKYSPFIPMFNIMDDIPAEYAAGTNQYDDNSAWWTFRSVGSLASASVLDGKYNAVVQQVWGDMEEQFINSQPYMNSMLKSMYKQDAKLAINVASDYSNGVLRTTLEKATELKSALMTDLTRSTEKKYSPEEFKKISNL